MGDIFPVLIGWHWPLQTYLRFIPLEASWSMEFLARILNASSYHGFQFWWSVQEEVSSFQMIPSLSCYQILWRRTMKGANWIQTHTLGFRDICSVLCGKLCWLWIALGSEVQEFSGNWNWSRLLVKRQSLCVWIKCICMGFVIKHSIQYYSKQNTECCVAAPFFYYVTWTTGRWLL